VFKSAGTIVADALLLPPPPRQLRRSRGYGQIVVYCCSLVLVVLFGQLFVRIAFGTIKFTWFSDVIPAQVIRVFTKEGKRGPNYYLELAYRINDADINASIPVSREEAQHQIGDQVEVMVLVEYPDSPQIYYSHYPKVLVTSFVSVLGLAPVAVIASLLWNLIGAPWRLRQLLREGELARGVIVDRKERKSKSPKYTLIYEFTAPAPIDAGQVNEVRVTVRGNMQVYAEDYRDCQIGDRVDIVFHPKKPRRNVIYRYADYQIVSDARQLT
jgi:hypothetical protein